MELRILTFNWHEGYIHLLSKLGCSFDVVQKVKGGVYGWIEAFRPVPPNCRLISEDEARVGLRAACYDRVIAHNLQDIEFVHEYETPKVLIFHNKLTCEIALTRDPIDRMEYLAQVSRLLETTRNLRLVFISEAKRLDWGFEGEVILPGIDPQDYGGYTGEQEKVLRVGNVMVERDVMLGYSVQQRLLKGLPSTVLGLNALIPEAIIPQDWDDLRWAFRNHRVYLNTTIDPYEDGYNLAMLEAMATGMPVVSLANASSPLQDGVNGYVSGDEGYLRDRIMALLLDLPLSRSLGTRARETVLDRFSMEAFLRGWTSVLDSAGRSVSVPVGGHSGCGSEQCRCGDKGDAAHSHGNREPGRLKILMSYTSNPQTTAFYLEKALRKDHDVITYGPRITEDILKAWNLEAIAERVRDHDLPYSTDDLAQVLASLPGGWRPDLFLWVESGVEFPLKGLSSLPCPSACYLVDTHLNLEQHLEIVQSFDHVFIAQEEYLPRFKEAGVTNVAWLPLACDPETHEKQEGTKCYGLSFVGSITPSNKRRNRFLLRLAERFPVHIERCFLEQMALVFSRSKMVFNFSVKNDLNMRVFEAMASGSLLITDEAKGSRLTDLFEDGKHLVLYRNQPELFERVDYYLKNHDERERIAAQGMREILEKHTYRHRTLEMMEVLASRGLFDSEPRASVAGHSSCRCSDTEIADQDAGIVPEGTNGEDLSDYYTQERHEVADLVPSEAVRILDVGCAGGRLGKTLKSRPGRREIWGVDQVPEAVEEARRWLDYVARANVNDWDPPVAEGYFDTVVFADVLEHLQNPGEVLKRYLPRLKATGAVVMSIPNVRHRDIIQDLAEGNWTYADSGILDSTHLRFFTLKEIRRLVEDCGLECQRVLWAMDDQWKMLPEGELIDLDLGRVLVRGLSREEALEFFVGQYLVVAVRKRGWLQEEAERLMGVGERTEAFAIYDTLFARYPDDPLLIKKLADLMSTREERLNVLARLEDYLMTNPFHVDFQLICTRLLVDEGRLEEARERLDRILLLKPDHAEARASLESLSS